MTLYAPGRREVQTVAQQATLLNSHPDAKGWLLDKVTRPPDDWDRRTFATVPGLIWTISSDTCMTGRSCAPSNIAYDDLGREFVFRQPANSVELSGIMSADSVEVFACYRFDGLQRWTVAGVDAWLDDHVLLIGWIGHRLELEEQVDIRNSLIEAHGYHTSDDFHDDVMEFRALLADRDSSGSSTRSARRR